MTLSLLGISGALRQSSTNTALVREAACLFGDADFTMADLRLPLYDGDIERDGIPPEVQQLAQKISDADAVIISTPEYNKMLSGVLKNALDWVSRAGIPAWKDKPVAILSAAAGRAGGERAQTSLRWAMQPFGPQIIQTPEVLIAQSSDAFDAQGHLNNERSAQALQTLMSDLRARATAN